MTDQSPLKLDQEIYICTASLVTEVPLDGSTLLATPSSSAATAAGTEAAATSVMTSPTACCSTTIATNPTGCPFPITTTSTTNYQLPLMTTTSTTSLVPLTAAFPTTGRVCTTSSSSAGPTGVVHSKGVCRKRSFKRHAPPPPSSSTAASLGTQAASLLTEEDYSSASNSVASAEELQGSMASSASPSGAPPAPERSVSSHEATRKHQGFASIVPQSDYEYSYDGVRGYPRTLLPTESSVNDYEFVDYGTGRADLYQSAYEYPYSPESYPSYAPQYAQVAPRAQSPTYGYGGVKPIHPWERGLQHSWSDGSVQYHHHQRRPKPPSFVARPLVPVLEEGASASSDNGTANVVRRPFSPSPPLLSPTSQTPPYCYPPPAASRRSSMTEAPGQARPRLDRSDSLVTVAHLYEDLLVVSPRLRVTLTNITVMVVVAAIALPNTATLLYTFFRLVFGTLFPAYYSYKAVKTKNVKEYVKWMMYWIVFAFFTCFETITDLLVAFWFPFYYELKILLVLWLLSPATRGSSVLYRKFVHPWLTQREGEIDECIAKAKQQGYSTVLQLGTKGVNYATAVIMQTAIKGGGGLVNQLKRSYSVGELAAGESDDHMDGGDYGGKHALAGDMNRNNVKALPAGASHGVTAYYDEEYSAHGNLSQQYQHLPPPPHAGITTAAEAPPVAQPQGVEASYSNSSSPPAATCFSGEFSPAGAATTVLSRRAAEVEEQPPSDGEESCGSTDTGKAGANVGRMATRSMSTARGGKRGGISRTRLFF